MHGDVIVIGGGLAGLTVANRAAEFGLDPICLEQGGDDRYPCNSRFSGGILHVAFKDMRAEESAIEAAIDAQVADEDATANSPLLAGESGRALEWLRGQGAKFIKGGAPEFMRWMLAPPRPRGAGLDWRGRGPDVLLRKLTANLEAHGKSVQLGTRVRDLLTDENGVVGVIAECDGVTQAFHAPAIVIADGGFQGHMALLREYISPAPEKLLQRGAATGNGDGLMLARELGAKLIGMDSFYGHLLGREALDNDKLWPYPIIDPIARVAVVVDATGSRFLDEGMGGVHMTNALARLEDPGSAAVIFDDAIWNGIAADNRYPPCMNPIYVNAGGKVLTADSLGDLAHLLNVPAPALESTVNSYNDAIGKSADGATVALEPRRTSRLFRPEPILEPPFRAIPLCPGITYTMGGIAVDGHSRVQREDGGLIAGLFAVGSASGGMEGGSNHAYIGGLAKAVVTGLRAAEAIARPGG